MNEDQSRKRLGRGLAALIGEMDQPTESGGSRHATPDARAADRVRRPQPAQSAPAFRSGRSGRSGQLHPPARHRAAGRRAGRRAPTATRSSPASAAGGPRSWPGLPKSRSWSAMSTTAPRLSSPSSRTCSAPTSMRSKRRRATSSSSPQHGYTQNDLGDIIGKSRSHVANSLRLLKLPETVRDMVRGGDLSAGHARAIVSTSDPVALARQIVSGGLSVRDAEKLAQKDAAGELASRRRSRRRRRTRTHWRWNAGSARRWG